MGADKTIENLIAENKILQSKLEEAQDAIDAIRRGEVDAFIVKDDNGHQLYTLKSADLTYRIFIEKMTEGAVTINKEGIILYCNTSFATMINRDILMVTGSRFINYIPDEFKEEINILIKDAWQEDQKVEIFLAGENQKAIPVLLSFNKLEIDGGIALSIISTDLSYQKETQEQLKQKNNQLEQVRINVLNLNEKLEETVKERTSELFKSREHFKFLADNIPTIVWTARTNGELDYFNNRWLEYTGRNCEITEDLYQFLHEDDRDSTAQAWKKAVYSKTPFEIEHRFKNTMNEYKWHHSHALPFKNDKGEVVAWFGISTDISEQKKALDKKDEFISIASHELKTPVTSIKGYVQLLRFNFQKEGNTKAAELLSKVDNQINKLTTLIGDLLDVKKIENGQLQFHLDHFDFNTLVQEVIEETGRILKNHTIQCELDDTYTLLGDRNKIGQVITNFIENAGKYAPAGTPIIIKTINEKNTMKLSVQDFGIGIPKEQQHRIFERFFRVAHEKENTYSGLGLGLYISHEIIKRHNGNIGVKSEKDKGSVFYFEIPV